MAAASTLLAAAAFAAPADRDQEFGSSGVKFNTGLDNASTIAVLPAIDDGLYTVTTGQRDGRWTMSALKHYANGTVDSAYNGATDVTHLTASGDVHVRAAALDGHQLYVVATAGSRALIARLRPDGNLDKDFSTDGVFEIVMGGTAFDDVPYAVAIDDAGRPLVAGTHTAQGATVPPSDAFVARITTTGTLDTTFNDPNGYVLKGAAGESTGESWVAHDIAADGNKPVFSTRNTAGSGAARIFRHAESGPLDGTFSGDGAANPGISGPVSRPLPLVLDTSGRPVVASEVDQSGGAAELVRLESDGDPDPTFGGDGTAAFATGDDIDAAGSLVTDLAISPLGVLTTIGTVQGGPDRLLLMRLTAAGEKDNTFAPGTVVNQFTTRDDLGTPNDTTGRFVAALGDKVLAAGTNGPRGFIARYGQTNQLPKASLTSSYPLIAGQQKNLARPGVAIPFDASGSTDPDGTVVRYDYDWDGNGSFEQTDAGPTPTHAYDEPGTYTVGVRVHDDDHDIDQAFREVRVVRNEAPTPMLHGRLPDSADLVPWLDEVPYGANISWLASGADLDGSIARVELDIDGAEGYEEVRDDSGTIIKVRNYPAEPETVTVGVKVFDDEGAVTIRRANVTITRPSCIRNTVEDSALGRLRITSFCWRKTIASVSGGETEITYESGPYECCMTVNGNPLAGATINGLRFMDHDWVRVVRRRKADGSTKWIRVRAKNARVEGLSNGVPLKLRSSGDIDLLYDRDDQKLRGLAVQNASFGGLKFTELTADPSVTSAGGLNLRFFPRLPQKYGGVSPQQAVEVPIGGTASARAAQNGGFSFEVSDAEVFGVGLENLLVSYDGDDSWDVAATVTVPAPVPISRITGEFGINDGDFAYGGASAEFTEPGVPLGSFILLQEVHFRIEVDAAEDTECVPHTGIVVLSMKPFRDLLVEEGFMTREEANEAIPDIQYDHGYPEFALCGGVKLTAGPQVLGASLARGDVDLGIAFYDDRADVFRAQGRFKILGLANLDTEFELYSSGYVRFRAEGGLTIPDILSLNGRLFFEAQFPKFNAEGSVEACVLFIDMCAGVKALISSKGLAACLRLYVLGERWEPGVTYEWGDAVPTPYMWGCDVGEVREHINGDDNVDVSLVPPSSRVARAAQVSAGSARQFVAKPNTPGMVIAVTGANKQIPHVILEGPDGRQIEVAPDRPSHVDGTGGVAYAKDFGVANVIIPAPPAGQWKMHVQPGSAPVISLRQGNGVEKPDIQAQVVRQGRRYSVVYQGVRPGDQVTFIERGQSISGDIGTTKLASGQARSAAAGRGRIAFSPAPGLAERREIVAIVTRNGLPVAEVPAGSYQAPPPRRPGKPGPVIARRKGTKLVVRWRQATDATRYAARVTLGNGRVTSRLVKGRRLTVAGVPRNEPVRIAVTGFSAAGLEGKPATKIVKPVKKKKKRKPASPRP